MWGPHPYGREQSLPHRPRLPGASRRLLHTHLASCRSPYYSLRQQQGSLHGPQGHADRGFRRRPSLSRADGRPQPSASLIRQQPSQIPSPVAQQCSTVPSSCSKGRAGWLRPVQAAPETPSQMLALGPRSQACRLSPVQVYNLTTYPNFVGFLECLGVDTVGARPTADYPHAFKEQHSTARSLWRSQQPILDLATPYTASRVHCPAPGTQYRQTQQGHQSRHGRMQANLAAADGSGAHSSVCLCVSVCVCARVSRPTGALRHVVCAFNGRWCSRVG